MKSADYKLRAKEALGGNWFGAVIAGFVASFLGATSMRVAFPIVSVNFEMDGGISTEGDVLASLVSGMGRMPFLQSAEQNNFTHIFAIIALVMAVYAVLCMFVGSAVGIGYAQFNLDITGGRSASISSLFSRFSQLKTAIYARILIFVRVFFGMLLIIPGIVMTYSYAMVFYVLAENPKMNAREALAESKRIMKGNRYKLFCLELSFVGWMLLSIFTLGIAYIWVLPYMEASCAAFYREAKRNA